MVVGEENVAVISLVSEISAFVGARNVVVVVIVVVVVDVVAVVVVVDVVVVVLVVKVAGVVVDNPVVPNFSKHSSIVS